LQGLTTTHEAARQGRRTETPRGQPKSNPRHPKAAGARQGSRAGANPQEHAKKPEPRRRTTARKTSPNERRGTPAHQKHERRGERQPTPTQLPETTDQRDTPAEPTNRRPRQGRSERTHTSRGETPRKAETKRHKREEKENGRQQKKKTRQHPQERKGRRKAAGTPDDPGKGNNAPPAENGAEEQKAAEGTKGGPRAQRGVPNTALHLFNT